MPKNAELQSQVLQIQTKKRNITIPHHASGRHRHLPLQRQVNLGLRRGRANTVQLPVQPERVHRAVRQRIGAIPLRHDPAHMQHLRRGFFDVDDVAFKLRLLPMCRRERQRGVDELVRIGGSTLRREIKSSTSRGKRNAHPSRQWKLSLSSEPGHPSAI